jgi:signal transduction histidine kinase
MPENGNGRDVKMFGKSKSKEKMEEDLSGYLYREIEIEFLIHELKDPISVIETNAGFLLENREKYGDLTPRQEKTLQRILRSSKKARGMLHDVLEIGRSKAGCFNCCRFMPVEAVYDVLIDSLETITGETIPEKERKGAGLVKCFEDHGIFLEIAPGVIEGEMEQDETKFRQITGNLFKNALYYRSRTVEIKIGKESDFLLLDVTDDGPGIEPEHQSSIFERYIRAGNYSGGPRKGHGIGLAGALVMAKHLGGDIKTESRKGKGATFKLTLPVVMKKL